MRRDLDFGLVKSFGCFEMEEDVDDWFQRKESAVKNEKLSNLTN